MKDFLNTLHLLRGTVRPGELPGLVLREAAERLGCAPHLTDYEEPWRRFTKQADYPLLQASAQALLNVDPASRLLAIDQMMQATNDGRNDHAWIATVPASMVAEIATNADKVRCAFGWSLHPALQLAVLAKARGRSTLIRFIDLNPSTCSLASLIAAVLEVDLDVVVGQPFERRDGQDFDFEICMPPFGWDLRDRDAIPKGTLDRIGATEKGRLYSEPVAIADLLAQARQSHAVVALSNNAMFRTVGVEAIARDELIESGRLSAVLSVPPGMVYWETQIATSFIALDPAGANKDVVRFIDLSDGRFATQTKRGRAEAKKGASWAMALEMNLDNADVFGRDVPVSEIRSQGGILTAERYLSTQASEQLKTFLAQYRTAALGDVVDLIRPVALPRAEVGSVIAREAAPADLGETGYLEPPTKETHIDRAGIRKARNQHLQPGDVLLSVKGTIGKVGLVPPDAPGAQEKEFWTAGQSLMILRSRPQTLAPEVLYEYLANELVHEHLKSLAGGAAIQSINTKDLKGLPVPLPDKAEQDQIVEAFRSRQEQFAEIRLRRRAIEHARAESWPHAKLRLEGEPIDATV